MQKLIMPLNNAIVSASFLNPNYEKKFGFKHYGVDFYGSYRVYSLGNGIVIGTGLCSLYGNYASVFYPKAYNENDLIFNFFHMAYTPLVNPGELLDKDTQIGVIGNTGKYAEGVHLHLECYIPEPWSLYKQSPFSSPSFSRLDTSLMLNPLKVLFTKKSPPDNQSIQFTQDGYCSQEDISRDYTLKED